jgi:hypothetical protein
LPDTLIEPEAAPEDREQAIASLRQSLAVEPTEPMASTHAAFTGRHSHAHSAYGSQAGDQTHDHSHSHNGDSNHGSHPHGASVSGLTPYSRMGEAERRKVDGANEVTDPEQLTAMVASALARYGHEPITAATTPSGDIVGLAHHAYLCPEGIRTDDYRELMVGACQFPDLPVSMRLLIEDEGGHWGAVTCGRIDLMDRREKDGLTLIYEEGVFGSDPNGQLAELMVTEQTQRFISIDPRDVEGEWITVTINVGDGWDDDEEIVDQWMRISSCVIGAATIVPMPAYPQAVITLSSVALPDAPIANASAPPSVPVAALMAAGGPVKPKRSWFDDPGFHVGDPRLVLQEDERSYACPLTITTDGQVFGHVAWWECTHTGFTGKKVKPPRSKSGYAYYLTGEGVECDDGTMIEGVGQLTAGCGHASTSLGWSETVAHYDGGYGAFQWADVRAGQDAFGPWIAGALRPGLSAEQVRQVRALSLSGDWREIGRNLELVAVLAVPVPGFPIRRALAASGSAELIDFCAVREGIRGERVVSLVAAGRVANISPETRIERLERELLVLRETVHTLSVDRARGLLSA